MTDQERAPACPLGELAVGWALHALEPAEEPMVAAHVAECEDCARIVSDTEYVGAVLGLSLPEVTPSPALDQRILAITNTREAAPVIPLVRSAKRSRQLMRPAGRILAAAAVVILAAASVTLGIRVVQLDNQRDQAVRQVTEISEAIQRATDPASVLVSLVTPDGRSMGVVLASRTDVSLVTTSALPRNRADDQIYVLWGLDHGTPRALTGFDVAANQPALHDVPSVPGDRQFAGYAVSLEPGRSAPAKPTTVMAMGMVKS